MKVGTIIKIRNRYSSDVYEFRDGDFEIDIDMYPGFGGYYGKFKGEHFYCLGTVDKSNPNYPGNKGSIQGLNLLNSDYETLTQIPQELL